MNQKFKKKYYANDYFMEINHSMYQHGFVLEEVIDLDKTYTERAFTMFERIYYSFFELPNYINPQLLIFYSEETNQKVKYYISTNIIYNKNDHLNLDIKESDALLVSDFIPSEKILEYYYKIQ